MCKYLTVKAETGWLIMHFGMTGKLIYSRSDESAPKRWDVAFEFDDKNRLFYSASRKLGRITWSEDRKAFAESKKIGS